MILYRSNGLDAYGGDFKYLSCSFFHLKEGLCHHTPFYIIVQSMPVLSTVLTVLILQQWGRSECSHFHEFYSLIFKYLFLFLILYLICISVLGNTTVCLSM